MPPPYWPFGNGAFEIAVIERMIFDLHRQPLVVRIERGAARDRPGFEDAVEFQPEIVVQPRRVMLLDHEAPPLRRRHLRLAAGLGGLFEIPLLSIGGEVLRTRSIPRQPNDPEPITRAACRQGFAPHRNGPGFGAISQLRFKKPTPSLPAERGHVPDAAQRLLTMRRRAGTHSSAARMDPGSAAHHAATAARCAACRGTHRSPVRISRFNFRIARGFTTESIPAAQITPELCLNDPP